MQSFGTRLQRLIQQVSLILKYKVPVKGTNLKSVQVSQLNSFWIVKAYIGKKQRKNDEQTNYFFIVFEMHNCLNKTLPFL